MTKKDNFVVGYIAFLRQLPPFAKVGSEIAWYNCHKIWRKNKNWPYILSSFDEPELFENKIHYSINKSGKKAAKLLWLFVNNKNITAYY